MYLQYKIFISISEKPIEPIGEAADRLAEQKKSQKH
jgi:hypothetical protein